MRRPKRRVVIFIAMAAVGANLELITRAFTRDLVKPQVGCEMWTRTECLTSACPNLSCCQGLSSASLAGWTSLWMWFVYGLVGLILGSFNEKDSRVKHWPMALQALLGCAVATVVELAAGLVLNKLLLLGTWDYEGRFLSLWGQICLRSAILFYGISPFAFWLDDVIRFVTHKGGPHPHPWHWYYRQLLDLRFKPREDRRAAM